MAVALVGIADSQRSDRRAGHTFVDRGVRQRERRRRLVHVAHHDGEALGQAEATAVGRRHRDRDFVSGLVVQTLAGLQLELAIRHLEARVVDRKAVRVAGVRVVDDNGSDNGTRRVLRDRIVVQGDVGRRVVQVEIGDIQRGVPKLQDFEALEAVDAFVVERRRQIGDDQILTRQLYRVVVPIADELSRVLAAAAVERIVADTAAEQVVARAAIHPVVTQTAEQRIHTVVAVKLVGPFRPKERVVVIATVERVVVEAAIKPVVAGTAAQHVVESVTDDPVVAAAADRVLDLDVVGDRQGVAFVGDAGPVGGAELAPGAFVEVDHRAAGLVRPVDGVGAAAVPDRLQDLLARRPGIDRVAAARFGVRAVDVLDGRDVVQHRRGRKETLRIAVQRRAGVGAVAHHRVGRGVGLYVRHGADAAGRMGVRQADGMPGLVQEDGVTVAARRRVYVAGIRPDPDVAGLGIGPRQVGPGGGGRRVAARIAQVAGNAGRVGDLGEGDVGDLGPKRQGAVGRRLLRRGQLAEPGAGLVGVVRRAIEGCGRAEAVGETDPAAGTAGAPLGAPEQAVDAVLTGKTVGDDNAGGCGSSHALTLNKRCLAQ